MTEIKKNATYITTVGYETIVLSEGCHGGGWLSVIDDEGRAVEVYLSQGDLRGIGEVFQAFSERES